MKEFARMLANETKAVATSPQAQLAISTPTNLPTRLSISSMR